jgi:hypothetical protein
MIRTIRKYLPKRYEEVPIPRDLAARMELIEGCIGKSVRILDAHYRGSLYGKIEESLGDNSYVLDPRFSDTGIILLAEHLLKLHIKNKSR